jgi:hypothetical protein
VDLLNYPPFLSRFLSFLLLDEVFLFWQKTDRVPGTRLLGCFSFILPIPSNKPLVLAGSGFGSGEDSIPFAPNTENICGPVQLGADHMAAFLAVASRANTPVALTDRAPL